MMHNISFEFQAWDSHIESLLAAAMEQLTINLTFSEADIWREFRPVNIQEGDISIILGTVKEWTTRMLEAGSRIANDPDIQERMPEAIFVFIFFGADNRLHMNGVFSYIVEGEKCLANEGVQCNIVKLSPNAYRCFLTSEEAWRAAQDELYFTATASTEELKQKYLVFQGKPYSREKPEEKPGE